MRRRNGKREALPTMDSRYSFPAFDVFGNFCRSTSSTFHGFSNLGGSIGICWLRDPFQRLHPHDNTYSRVSLHMLGQWNQSRNNDIVLATPGCLCWQCMCIKASRSCTRPFGTASADVHNNVPLRSISSHKRLWVSIRCLYMPASVKPFGLGTSLTSPWLHNSHLRFPKKGSDVCILTR